MKVGLYLTLETIPGLVTFLWTTAVMCTVEPKLQAKSVVYSGTQT